MVCIIILFILFFNIFPKKISGMSNNNHHKKMIYTERVQNEYLREKNYFSFRRLGLVRFR